MRTARSAHDQAGEEQEMGQDLEAGAASSAEAVGQDGLAAEFGIECAGEASMPADLGAQCGGEVSLAGRSEAEAQALLVAQTARFSASFLRWMETRTCDGMNFARLRLLQALHCGGPAIMRDLGTQLGATPRNMTALVDALEEAQLVVRRPHPTDRRATLIELSPDGAREAEEGLGPRLSAMSEIFAGLSAAEREQFSAAMTKLIRAIRERQGDGC
jgi:DNA-binding MarR family transcriptional regulator